MHIVVRRLFRSLSETCIGLYLRIPPVWQPRKPKSIAPLYSPPLLPVYASADGRRHACIIKTADLYRLGHLSLTSRWSFSNGLTAWPYAAHAGHGREREGDREKERERARERETESRAKQSSVAKDKFTNVKHSFRQRFNQSLMN
jgi:hypothetical protein